MDDPLTVTLWVDGTGYEGWTDIQITSSLRDAAGTFRIGLTEKYPGQQFGRAIKPTDPCTLAFEDEVLITGFVDDVLPGFSSDDHRITITGRDKTADLVDCSAESGQWFDLKLEDIAREIARPFGIGILSRHDSGAVFPSFKINEGETAFAAIERAARLRGFLLSGDGQGQLVITRAGSGRAREALVEGANLLAADGAFSAKDRFSLYRIKGQQNGFGDLSPEEITAALGEARDPAIPRYRPLILQAESASDPERCVLRARHEASVRAAEGRRVKATVQGWQQKPGQAIWQTNTLVSLSSPSLGLDNQTLLIESVTRRLSEGGTTTELNLVPQGSYDVLAPLQEDSSWLF